METTESRKLTGKQRRQLRALGHHLNPVVQIGKEGVSEAVVALTERELLAHELIKVKVLETAPVDAEETAAALAGATRSHLAQVIGRTALLYRTHPEKPGIVLV
jgi:RNA-binding protein